jgi:hypothetical protein
MDIQTITYHKMGIIVCIIILIITVLVMLKYFIKKGCSSVVPSIIKGIGKQDKRFQGKLRDYYIKSSYNSCSRGKFQNDWVNLCALENVIAQGCRVLDFEIYDVDGKAVVATSNSTKYTEKGTFNSIPIDSVMKTIAEKAVSFSLSNGYCPNPFDPLLLHFRFKTSHVDIYNQVANSIVEYLDYKLLSSEYSYENQGKNIGSIELNKILGKIIIMVDKIENNHIRGTKLEELTNIMGNSAFLRSLPYNDVIHTPDMDELIDYNKKCMTISYPNLSYQSNNYNSSAVMQYGVQMPAMCYQTNDSFLKAYNMLFEQSGYAFLMKPIKLRYISVEVEEPTTINPSVSYGYKTHKTNYYNFNL